MEQRPECPMEHVRAAGGVFPCGSPTLEMGSCLPSPVREKVSRDATDEGVELNAAGARPSPVCSADTLSPTGEGCRWPLQGADTGKT